MSKLIDSRLIGQSIKNLRLSRHWTQDYLASIVGYSVRNLRRIENDGTGSIDVVNTFADIFEVSALDILDGVSFLLKTYKKSLLNTWQTKEVNCSRKESTQTIGFCKHVVAVLLTLNRAAAQSERVVFAGF
jgi:transcriptional regulator with XRE-family HTH domain